SEIMEVAAELLVRHHPSVRPPRSVRASGEAPRLLRVEDVPGAVAALVAEHTEGQLAIIAQDADEPVDLTEKVVRLTPAAAKGLEFDVVVIVLSGPLRPNDLYVAMTRATRRLCVVQEATLVSRSSTHGSSSDSTMHFHSERLVSAHLV
ncbi:MAG TPA: ATP-binding domain-containing protein, partial [Lentzea sp.]